MSASFASQADLSDKVISFTQLSENAWAYTAQGDPNSGVIIGRNAVMVIDTTATPLMAQDLIARIRALTDKPIRYVVLSHYHAVRVLGASAYKVEGAQEIIASRPTHELIVERGAQDMLSEIERFPRLFRGRESIPGLTWPSLVFEGKLTLMLDDLEVEILQPGPGHTRGDTVVWIPSQRVGRPRRVRGRCLHRRCTSARVAGNARSARSAAARKAHARTWRGDEDRG